MPKAEAKPEPAVVVETKKEVPVANDESQKTPKASEASTTSEASEASEAKPSEPSHEAAPEATTTTPTTVPTIPATPATLDGKKKKKGFKKCSASLSLPPGMNKFMEKLQAPLQEMEQMMSSDQEVVQEDQGARQQFHKVGF